MSDTSRKFHYSRDQVVDRLLRWSDEVGPDEVGPKKITGRRRARKPTSKKAIHKQERFDKLLNLAWYAFDVIPEKID